MRYLASVHDVHELLANVTAGKLLDARERVCLIGRNGAVFDGRTGDAIAQPNSDILVYSDPVVGDVDADGTPDIVANKVFSWTGTGWTEKYAGPNKTTANAPLFYAFADFGTPGSGSFDFNTLDGIAEIVTSGSEGLGMANENAAGHVAVYALDGTEVLKVSLPSIPTTELPTEIGGPPTVGDFEVSFSSLMSPGKGTFFVAKKL